MKYAANKQKEYLGRYAAIPLAVAVCVMLSACGGGGETYKVKTGWDYEIGSLRDVLENETSDGDTVRVEGYVGAIEVYGDAIKVSDEDVLLKGNGSNHLDWAVMNTIAPALSNDVGAAAHYVDSGWLNANADRAAVDAQYQGLTQIYGGENGLFDLGTSGNEFNMRNIHVIGVTRDKSGDLVGGVISAHGSSSAKIGSMTDTLFTDIEVTTKGNNSEVIGGVLGAYSSSKNAYIGNIQRSLFDNIDIYSGKETITGGAIGAEGKKAVIGNIEQSQFSYFKVDSGYRVIGGAVGAVGNSGSETSTINYINQSLFTNFEVSASDFIVGGVAGVAATASAEQTGIGNSVFADVRVEGKQITGGAIGLRSDHGNASLYSVGNSYIGHVSSQSATDIVGGAIGLAGGWSTSNYTEATLGAVSNSLINQNYALASGNVYGGAIGLYVNQGKVSIGSIDNTTMRNNTADSSSSAYGGAVGVYANNGIASLGPIRNSTFTGNMATSDFDAYGGAIYATGLQGGLEIRNSYFTNNQATSHTNAYGGAIFIDTRAANNGQGHALSLVADSGQKTLFQGNQLADSSGARNNAIHFGSTIGVSAENAVLNIQTAAGGEVALYDPVTVGMNNGKSFTLNKGGAGTFYWDGANTVAAQGGNRVNLNDGKTILGNGFNLNSNGNTLNVAAGAGSSLEFMGNRNPATAMFDFSGTSSSSLSAGSGVKFGVSSRQLTDVSGTFLVAQGLSNYSQFTPSSNGSVTGYDTATPGQLKVNVNYTSTYRAAIARSANTTQAQYALNDLVSDTAQVSDDTFDNIANNLSDVTAEYGMTQAMAALGTHQTVLRSVNQLAYVNPQRQQLLSAKLGLGAGKSFSELGNWLDQNSFRVWGGSMDDLSKAGSYASYQGHQTDTNGMVFGASYRVTSQLDIGAYTAYADGKSRLQGNNASVTTNSHYYGLMGSYALTPKWTLQGDIGGARYTNTGQRCAGNVCSGGEFEQNLYTAGGELGYSLEVRDVAVRPFGGLRYTSFKQDGFTEQGGVISSSVDGFDLTSVSSSFGLSLSKVFALNRGYVMPELSFAWRHEWADAQASSVSNYSQRPDQRFAIGSYKNDRDFADVQFGLRSYHQLNSGKSLSTFVSYKLGLSEHTNDHSLNAGLQWRF